MRFEEFETAKPAELKRLAKQCFEESQEEYVSNEQKVSLLLEAQFYVAEADRRSGGRIALRDLILEIIVILLIGFEIILAIKQGIDEDKLMDKQNGILSSLQQSTSATASTLQGLLTLTGTMNESTSKTASTLGALESTTKIMNRAVHDQIELFYDPSVLLSYDPGGNRVLFVNTGRSSLTLSLLKMDGQTKNIGGNKLLSAGSTIYVEIPSEYKKWSDLPKGSGRNVPVEAHLTNELGRKYVLSGGLFFVWENDKIVVHGQNYSLTPEQ